MYFTELLPPGANDIIVVLRNDCHQEFTYEVDGIESFPVGPGDLHESKYDYLGVHTSLDSIMKLDKESYDIPEHLQNASCSYSFSAYPSQAFEDSYHTNKPVIYAIVLASLFVFTSMVFLLYDWMVERRQQKVLKSAQQSGQLVHSLYPKATLEKLYEEQEEEKARSKEEGIFLNYKDRESAVQPKEAIASLYPETTIFFADLAGAFVGNVYLVLK